MGATTDGRTSRGGCLKITAFGMVLVVVLALVVVLFGDGFVRSRIEQQVGSSMTTSLGGQTTVTLDDRSVLLGIARNRFESLNGTAPTARFTQGTGDQKTTLTVKDLSFTATGVGNLRGSGPYAIEQLGARATVTYAELSRLAGTEITSAGGDRVKLRQSTSLWGAEVAIEVTARPGLGADGSLTLDDPAATVSGISVPETLLRPLMSRITDRVELPPVSGMGYDSLTAGTGGVSVTMSGSNVELPR